MACGTPTADVCVPVDEFGGSGWTGERAGGPALPEVSTRWIKTRLPSTSLLFIGLAVRRSESAPAN